MSELIKMAVMNLQEAKQFQKELAAQDVSIVLNHDDKTCTRGCAITVEVHAREIDMPMIQKVYSEIYAKLLDGHDVNAEQMNAVYDTSQAEALCPACGHRFATGPSECPDCGLGLG
jgi:rubrerythrin